MEGKPRGLVWKLLQCWWIPLTLVLGLLSWAAFLYAGFRARKRIWIASAAGYLVLAWITISPPDVVTATDNVGGVALFTMALSFVHALIIRSEFLARLQLLDEAGPMSEIDLNLLLARKADLRREAAEHRILDELRAEDHSEWEHRLRDAEVREASEKSDPSSHD